MEKMGARTAAALALALLVACVSAHGAAAQQASGVVAVKNSYTASDVNWDLRAPGVYCATADADEPLEWRQRYGWASFCGPAGPEGEASCGRCLWVKNEATEAAANVRIVDECSDFDGLGLDPSVFSQLDTDGNGEFAGQLTVSYQFIDCQD
jgi:hypothetical protein